MWLYLIVCTMVGQKSNAVNGSICVTPETVSPGWAPWMRHCLGRTETAEPMQIICFQIPMLLCLLENNSEPTIRFISGMTVRYWNGTD